MTCVVETGGGRAVDVTPEGGVFVEEGGAVEGDLGICGGDEGGVACDCTVVGLRRSTLSVLGIMRNSMGETH